MNSSPAFPECGALRCIVFCSAFTASTWRRWHCVLHDVLFPCTRYAILLRITYFFWNMVYSKLYSLDHPQLGIHDILDFLFPWWAKKYEFSTTSVWRVIIHWIISIIEVYYSHQSVFLEVIYYLVECFEFVDPCFASIRVCLFPLYRYFVQLLLYLCVVAQHTSTRSDFLAIIQDNWWTM